MLPAASACGKKGAPLPPLRVLPEKVSGLHARQIGDRIVLSFPPPSHRTDGAPLGSGAVLEVLLSARDPVPSRPIEIQNDPAVTWTVPASDWKLYAQGARMEVGLRLERIASGLALPSGSAGLSQRKLSFVVDIVEAGGRRSQPSDIATFLVCDPPSTPETAAARIAEEGLLLTWRAATTAEAGLHYLVYRQDDKGPRPELPVNEGPGLTEPSYMDGGAVVGHSYTYTVRAARQAAGCESADSAAVVATRRDLFPPSPPQGLAAVSEPGVIRLFWRPNREPDLHGYRVYRADGPAGALKLLTSDDLTATTYTDPNVAPGVVYSYAVTARDGASPPNESQFSDQAAEILEKPK
jgi:hypothetical protein